MTKNIMDYGITTNYFIEYSPEEAIGYFAEKGWYKLELADEHVNMLLTRQDPKKEIREFKKCVGDHGVTFPQGHLLLRSDIVDDEYTTVDELRRWLDIFISLGVEKAVLHPGGAKSRKKGIHIDEIRNRQVERLRPLLEHVEGTNVIICIENTPDTETTVDGLLEIVRLSSSDNIGICLDTGHLNMAGGDQEDFILKADSHLKALHIHGNDGKSDQHTMPYAQHRSRGYIDWLKVVEALKTIGYEGLFNLEIGGEGSCPLEIKLAKLDYLDTIIPIMLS